MKTVLTFGETLNQLIQKKKYTNSSLCRKMGLKSQTTLLRILDDESSVKKITAFYQEFEEQNPLGLVKFEMQQLKESILINTIGKEQYLANQLLMSFITKLPPVGKCSLQKSFGDVPLSFCSLDDLFETYGKFSNVRICILNSTYESVISACQKVLCNNPKTVSIEHYLCDDKCPSTGIASFVNLLSLINIQNYNCYWTPSAKPESTAFINSFHNMMIAVKEAKDGSKFFDIITMTSPNTFTLLYHINNSYAYDFYHSLLNDMKENHLPLKFIVKGLTQMDTYINLSQLKLDYQLDLDEVCITFGFNFQQIPVSIFNRLADSLLIELDSVQIQHLKNTHNTYYQAFMNNTNHYTHICTKQGILFLLNTGRLNNHFTDFFPSLTKEESKIILLDYLNLCETNESYSIRLLKNEIEYNDYNYLLYGTEYLFFRNNDENNISNQYYCEIKTDYIIRSFAAFTEYELLPKHCYSQAESIAFIKTLLADA